MHLKRHLYAAAGATALAGLAFGTGPARAQSADGAQVSTVETVIVESVVVTGRRNVVTSVETLKETASAIVDSITSEEIDKTADITLPEALDRVVGVSSDGFFSSSDAGYVSLRGFDSRYNSMAIDGNPIWFSSQNNRGAQIGMFPSAIVKETSVYKTVTPEMDANSVGGHIALRTLRAFDGGTQPYFRMGGRLGSPEQESRVSDQQPFQAYLAGKMTFGANDQFGLVVGANHQHTADRDDMGSVSGYSQVAGPDGRMIDVITGNVFSKESAVDKETENTALFAKLETRIEDRLYGFLSVNRFEDTKNYYIQRAGPYIAPTGGRTVTPTGEGTARFTNGQGQVREFDYVMERSANVVGAGLDVRIVDDGVLVLRGNHTDYKNDTLTRNTGGGFRLSGINGAYDITGDTPIITPDDPALYNDARRWVFLNTANASSSAAYLRYQPLRDEVSTLGATFNYNNSAASKGLGASVGVNWVRLDRSFDQTQDFYALRSGVTLNLAQVAGPSMEGNRAALGDYNAFYDFLLANGSVRRSEAETADYMLREDILAYHIAAYYAAGPLKLVAGVRYEGTTDETVTGQVVSGAIRSLERRNEYGEWLPNIQGSYDFSDRLKLRLAYTETIGRADFQDFAPGTTTTFDANGVTVINGSNGDIGARISTNYDASLEYYFDDGLIAVAAFKKDLGGEIFRQRTEVFDESGMLSEIRTIPLNNGQARVTGLEVTASADRLGLLPAPFDRIGVSANYTYLDGQWDVVFENGSTRSVEGLRNQPQWLSNVNLSYDFGLFDMNVNYRGRGKTFTGAFGAVEADDVYVHPQHTLDLQLNLRPTRKLRMTVDVKNVTKEYQVQYKGIDQSIFNSLGRGREYWIGLHYHY